MIDANIDIRRVALRFYTWRLQYGDNIVIGYGPKASAREAAQRFIRKHGGTPLPDKVLV